MESKSQHERHSLRYIMSAVGFIMLLSVTYAATTTPLGLQPQYAHVLSAITIPDGFSEITDFNMKDIGIDLENIF